MSVTSIYNSCDNILAGCYPSPVSPVYRCAMILRSLARSGRLCKSCCLGGHFPSTDMKLKSSAIGYCLG